MADHRHKRDTDARRTSRATLVAGPLALVATASIVVMGVALSDAPATDTITASTTAADLAALATSSGVGVERGTVLSRSSDREEESKLERVMSRKAVEKAIEQADTKLWTTARLNLWTEPGEKADRKGVIAEARKVLVTGRSLYGRDEIVVDGKARWVTTGYLAQQKPTQDKPAQKVAPATAPATATCTNGSSVPSGVSPNIVAVHQAVCAAFPTITSYGTLRGDGEHAQGIAIDIMVSGDLGYRVADFIRANYAELGVSYIIYAQRIWSVDRGGEGWRGVADRGSTTANHYDHVHVTTY